MRTMFESLVIEIQDGIALLTLNEPETRNAMSERMTREFPQAIAQIGADPAVRGLIITGAGSAFSRRRSGNARADARPEPGRQSPRDGPVLPPIL